MFSKKDIMSNYLVKTRENKIGMVISSNKGYVIVFQLGGYVQLNDYGDGLLHNSDKGLDIMMVKDVGETIAFNYWDKGFVLYNRKDNYKINIEAGDVVSTKDAKFIAVKPKYDDMALINLQSGKPHKLDEVRCESIIEIYKPHIAQDYYISPKNHSCYKYNRSNCNYCCNLEEKCNDN